MGRSRIVWAAATFAPWALALGLLVSITARADPDLDMRGLSLPVHTRLQAGFAGRARLIEANYVVGDADDLAALPDEIEPRYAPKRVRVASPAVNRADKGDPFIVLRPGFEAKAHASQTNVPAEAMTPAVRVASSDGATPAWPLARALAAVSPSPTAPPPVNAVEKTPAPVAGFIAARTDLTDRPGYATLIGAKDRARQLRCLAEAIYFEARSEPEAGQAAVAEVVLNRVRSGIYPTTVCGVVYQDREHPFACQFSFACEGKSLRVEEPGPWATATRIAEGVADGKMFDKRFASAINYHAVYVRPFWAPTLKRLDRIGLHVFYAMRPGLYWAPGALNGRGDLPPLMADASR
jgi:spore germination cell wall hydrolase CwlJ-like protein